MTEIDQQIQQLIDDSPEDRGMPLVMEYAIAPILKALAQELQHQDYYILQSTDEKWQVTTLRHRQDDNLTKRVVYGFPTFEDASTFAQYSDPDLMALPVPVTHALFELLAFEQVDSIILFDESGNYENGTEITREGLQKLIREQLKKVKEKAQQHNFA